MGGSSHPGDWIDEVYRAVLHLIAKAIDPKSFFSEKIVLVPRKRKQVNSERIEENIWNNPSYHHLKICMRNRNGTSISILYRALDTSRR